MLIISNGASTNLQALPDSEIDGPISNNNITSLAERRNDTRNRRKSLSIYNASLCTQTRSNIRLSFHVYILRAVELRRTTRSHAIGSQSLNSLLFNLLVANEVIEIVGCEVSDGSAVRELDSRSSWS
jgi:hypothetical protein